MGRYTNDGHITDSDIERFDKLLMDSDELVCFAEHIADCGSCAKRLAEGAEKSDLHVPKGFAPEVRRRIVTGTQKDFQNYCLRVCAAVCASLMLLFTGELAVDSLLSVPAPKLEFLDKMTQTISEFSNNIINWEVTLNGKEK